MQRFAVGERNSNNIVDGKSERFAFQQGLVVVTRVSNKLIYQFVVLVSVSLAVHFSLPDQAAKCKLFRHFAESFRKSNYQKAIRPFSIPHTPADNSLLLMAFKHCNFM